VALPPAFTAEVIACWLSEFWLGMEFADLLGVKEEQLTHRAALDAVQQLLEALDARSASAARKPMRKAAAPATARKAAARKSIR
jgi:hypothetical protein